MILSDQASDGLITILTARGRLTFPEICSKMVDFSIDDRSSRVLCDLSHATVADLTTNEIEDIIKLIGRQINGYRGGKAAIVAHGSVDFGLARMVSTFSELADLPVKVKAFRTAEVAKTWLSDKTRE
jgi:hypothetical protein